VEVCHGKIRMRHIERKERKCHLTNLNADYNGNFPILSFGDCTENGARTKQIEVYVQDTCFAVL
jgi:hypothetical protein